ncbi:MAG: type VI secretion system protein TssA [Planctomycetaceae bacterium]|jgi:type VI secretion system ImpA family protein|nr:type VI secretion system protein TssA [Planctomycetaceae bacterium]
MKTIFDLETILKPINETEPCGLYLFYEPIYDSIQEARREEDASLPQGVWEHQLKQADWEQVLSLCIETLISRSKDLQIAVWGTEAATVLFGVRGLLEGIVMIRSLAVQFWDNIHPQLQPNDTEIRCAPLEWCDSVFCRRLRQTPLAEQNQFSEQIFSWNDWINAEYQEQLQMHSAKPQTTEEKTNILNAIDATPTTFYLNLSETLIKLNRELAKFQTFLHEKLGETAPALFQLREEVDKIQTLVNKWLIERKGIDLNKQSEIKPERGESIMSNENSVNFSEQNSAEKVLTVTDSDVLKTRQEAYLLLERAAEILIQCEPHSPVPYLVRRLVAWKDKSLDELMQELTQRGVDYYLLLKLFPDMD